MKEVAISNGQAFWGFLFPVAAVTFSGADARALDGVFGYSCENDHCTGVLGYTWTLGVGSWVLSIGRGCRCVNVTSRHSSASCGNPLMISIGLKTDVDELPATLFAGRPERVHHLWNIYRHQALPLLSQRSRGPRWRTSTIVLQQSRPELGSILFYTSVTGKSTTLHI